MRGGGGGSRDQESHYEEWRCAFTDRLPNCDPNHGEDGKESEGRGGKKKHNLRLDFGVFVNRI